jgi:hypothetical protein
MSDVSDMRHDNVVRVFCENPGRDAPRDRKRMPATIRRHDMLIKTTQTTASLDILKGRARRQARKAARQRAVDMRGVNKAFRLWHECIDATCRRARACCSQDTETCFRQHAEAFPPEKSIWIRAIFEARKMGCDWEQARQAGRDAVARYRARLAHRSGNDVSAPA